MSISKPVNSQVNTHIIDCFLLGYAILSADAFNLDPSRLFLRMEVTLRTEAQSGMVFFAHGPDGVFIVLQIVDGDMTAGIRGSDSVQRVVTFPKEKGKICDGKWHKIIFVKSGGQLTLAMERSQNAVTVVGPGPRERITLPISSNFYVGGIKPGSLADKFIQENGLQSYIQQGEDKEK